MILGTTRQVCLALAVGLAGAASCGSPGGPGKNPFAENGVQDAAALSDVPAAALGICNPVRSAEPLPARALPTVDDSQTTTIVNQSVFVNDLYGLFKSYCGGCHVEQGLGNFKVTSLTFSKDVDAAKVLASVKSDDPTKFMPPLAALGKAFSQRKPGDPILELLGKFEQWFAQGKPAEVFYVPTEVQTGSRYVLGEKRSTTQTNMGTCIPERAMVATDQGAMDKLDTFFAQATELPDNLAETDLVSMDAEDLSRLGVISFAPAYPLWSENSGKMRLVRVPHGKSIKFDKAAQKFDIPPNTRFYKTFLKKVIDMNGDERWRKMETRLIVARADKHHDDGPDEPQALFGTYAWNDDETDAVLVRDPLRNGKPFRDRLLTYAVDEPKFQEISDSHPANLNFALEEENTGVIRRYAIPGSQRCIECHQGSPMANFVLGFQPVQIRRRPLDEAGVYEPAGPDELNQLQRLIDYGVITGVTSPSDIRGLEEPQGERRYRNKYELKAQAYLMGNCSHCHNPRGFPSVKAPELKDLLNFLPSETGGIFAFPLERTSPLRRRGALQDTAMPYITPSLRDFPVGAESSTTWAAKFLVCKQQNNYCTRGGGAVQFLDAPWRSLIYRNVDTPYIYADDYAIFPHMPRHSFGFDCRAPRIMGDWMVSIPAFYKAGINGPGLGNNLPGPAGPAGLPTPVDYEPQPFYEVTPKDPDYEAAVRDAQTQLDAYHGGKRYGYCPDSSDIVDRGALATSDQKRLVPPDLNQYADVQKKLLVMPIDGVPDKAHVVVTDLTDAPGDWYPRRPDWQDVLINPKASKDPNAVDVPTMLQEVRITPELRAYALGELPFGMWQAKPNCDFSGVKQVKDFVAAERPAWMENAPPDAPVYSLTPGAAVFNNICVNCHGPQADSKGLLAEAISEMSGGDARVANFKEGLFGPFETPGSNLLRVYGPVAAKSTTPAKPVTAQDVAGRYLAWMALGGTQRLIPPALLAIVGTTPVLGERRTYFAPEGSPNMLQVAQKLCASVLSLDRSSPIPFLRFFNQGKPQWKEWTALIHTNGDADLWLRLCSAGNRPVVRALVVEYDDSHATRMVARLALDPLEALFWADGYPPTAPVMNHRGIIETGVTAANTMPSCVIKPSEPAVVALVTQFLKDNPAGAAGEPLPFCPAELFQTGPDGTPKWQLRKVRDEATSRYTFVDGDKWSARGAMNAGLAVFLYLQEIEKGAIKPKPAFNHCEEIRK